MCCFLSSPKCLPLHTSYLEWFISLSGDFCLLMPAGEFSRRLQGCKKSALGCIRTDVSAYVGVWTYVYSYTWVSKCTYNHTWLTARWINLDLWRKGIWKGDGARKGQAKTFSLCSAKRNWFENRSFLCSTGNIRIFTSLSALGSDFLDPSETKDSLLLYWISCPRLLQSWIRTL